MCHLFVGADPTLWENETRSLRLSGMATSVRLERFFWTVLLDIAERDHLTVSSSCSVFMRNRLMKGMTSTILPRFCACAADAIWRFSLRVKFHPTVR